MNEIGLFNEIKDASPPLLTSFVIMIILAAAKAAGLPDRIVPVSGLVLGAALYPILAGWSMRSALLGLVVGGFPTGLHQVWKQFNKAKDVGTMALALAGLSLLAGSGCATPNGAKPAQLQNVERTSALVRTSAQLGVYYAMRQEPKTRAYFEAAHLALDVLLKEGQYDPAQLHQALGQISIEELRSEDVRIAIEAAVNLYSACWSEQVQASLEREIYIRPVLAALRDGISFGLNAPLPESASNAPDSKQ